MSTRTQTNPPRKKRKTCRIAFDCDPDLHKAFLAFVKYAMAGRSIANAARCILRNQIIKSPTEITVRGFPIEQSLELWVYAAQAKREAGVDYPTDRLKFTFN